MIRLTVTRVQSGLDFKNFTLGSNTTLGHYPSAEKVGCGGVLGSAIPRLQKRVEFLESLLPMLGSVELLRHIGRILNN